MREDRLRTVAVPLRKSIVTVPSRIVETVVKSRKTYDAFHQLLQCRTVSCVVVSPGRSPWCVRTSDPGGKDDDGVFPMSQTRASEQLRSGSITSRARDRGRMTIEPSACPHERRTPLDPSTSGYPKDLGQRRGVFTIRILAESIDASGNQRGRGTAAKIASNIQWAIVIVGDEMTMARPNRCRVPCSP